MDAVNATRGGLALTGGGRPALVVGLTDMLTEADEAEGNRLVVRSSDGDSVMTVVFQREQSPFTALDRENDPGRHGGRASLDADRPSAIE